MCIFFLPSECSCAGLNAATLLTLLYNRSRRPSTEDATSFTQLSIMSSRSSVTTMSSYSNGSSESLHEMFAIKEDSYTGTTSEHPTKHFRIATSSDREVPPTSSTAEDLVYHDYVTAINTITNMLENKSGVQVGRCVDPSSSNPNQCKNFQIRHRSSTQRQTGWFDKCIGCTKVGKQWQESREAEGLTWEQVSQTSSRGQKVKKAETGMCSAGGCEGCKPTEA